MALLEAIFEAGKSFDLTWHAADAMGTRRIEAGIFDNGTDLDKGFTPTMAGLEKFVDFTNENFIGRDALLRCSSQRLLFGVMTDSLIPTSNFEVHKNDRIVGKITAGDWSPELKCGIGYVRFFKPDDILESWLHQKVLIKDNTNSLFEAKVVNLPFFDKDKNIPKSS